jgi:hypothetical protein
MSFDCYAAVLPRAGLVFPALSKTNEIGFTVWHSHFEDCCIFFASVPISVPAKEKASLGLLLHEPSVADCICRDKKISVLNVGMLNVDVMQTLS